MGLSPFTAPAPSLSVSHGAFAPVGPLPIWPCSCPHLLMAGPPARLSSGKGARSLQGFKTY